MNKYVLGAIVSVQWACFAIGTAQATDGAYPTANGAYASGIGGTSVALPQDAIVAADNPAGMAEVGSRADLYGLLLITESKSSFGSEQNRLTSQKTVPAPGLGVNFQIGRRWTLGLSVTGMAVASDYGKSALPIPGTSSAKASLLTVNSLPTLTYRLLPNLAIGAALVLGLQQFSTQGVVAADANGQIFELPNHGDSWAAGIGASLGVLWKPLPYVSLGGAYFTPTRFSSLSGYKDDLLASSHGHLDSPWRADLGIAVTPLPGATLALDYLHIAWSHADGFNIRDSFNWRDQDVVRFGAQYRFNPRFVVRAGYSHANSHLDSEHTLANFYAPGINHRAVTAGLSVGITEKLECTGAFEHNIPRTIRGTGPSQGTNIRTTFEVVTLGCGYRL
jgi:long-chain fatty acid transport protein